MGENEIHFWELPPKSTYITLKLEEQKRIFSEAALKFPSTAEFAEELRHRSAVYGFNCGKIAGNISSWKQGVRRSVPLWVLNETGKIASGKEFLENEEMRIAEARIEHYQSAGRGIEISGKFPIRVTPEFDAIVSHLMGDGTLGTDKSYASYKQKNGLARRNFLQQLFNVFGIFQINPSFEKYWQVCIPKPIELLIKMHYGLGDAGCLERRLPPAIKNKPKEHRLAALLAFLVDEGHIGDAIELYSGNRELLQDYQDLAMNLGYNCSKINSRKGNKTPNQIHSFRISLKDSCKLLEDIRALSLTFPNLGLAHKQPVLEEIVFRQSLEHHKKNKNKRGETKQKILALAETGITTQQLVAKLHVGGQTIREHLAKLEAAGVILKCEKTSKAILWRTIPVFKNQ